ATAGNRVAGLGDDDRVLWPIPVEDELGEAEDRLLASIGRNDLAVGVEVDAEPPPAPAGDRLAQLRQPLRLGVPHHLAEPVDQSVADQRVGRLSRVALAEVDDLDPGLRRLALRALDPDEGVGALRSENGR